MNLFRRLLNRIACWRAKYPKEEIYTYNNPEQEWKRSGMASAGNPDAGVSSQTERARSRAHPTPSFCDHEPCHRNERPQDCTMLRLEHPGKNIHSEWFCSNCQEELDLEIHSNRCRHCGSRVVRKVIGYWVFLPDGSKDYFQSIDK
jgi:DNA-directed RNA polymerase subunit RPC12/RpoP